MNNCCKQTILEVEKIIKKHQCGCRKDNVWNYTCTLCDIIEEIKNLSQGGLVVEDGAVHKNNPNLGSNPSPDTRKGCGKVYDEVFECGLSGLCEDCRGVK